MAVHKKLRAGWQAWRWYAGIMGVLEAEGRERRDMESRGEEGKREAAELRETMKGYKVKAMGQIAGEVARGCIFRHAFIATRDGYLRAVLRSWHFHTRTSHSLKERAATTVFNLLSNRLNVTLLLKGWIKLKQAGYFEARHVARAWGSRKGTSIKSSVMDSWKKLTCRRKRARDIVERNVWDKVTKAFYCWVKEWVKYRDDKILYLRRISKLVKSLKPPMRQRMKEAFKILHAHARNCSDILERSFMRWRIEHIHCLQRKSAMRRIVSKHTRPKHYFRLWLQRVHERSKFELSQSTVKIYQTLAAGNLAMSLETMQRRKMVLSWMNISLNKAFKVRMGRQT